MDRAPRKFPTEARELQDQQGTNNITNTSGSACAHVSHKLTSSLACVKGKRP